MKPLTLDIENFFSIKKATIPLAAQGMVLVLGENQDAPKSNSNGSGKSSILEALFWCCWGETICGLSGDDVVNERVGKNCRVTMTFEDEGKRYVVTRTRLLSDKGKKPNDLTFTVDDEDATKESIKATQKVVTEALGVDFNTFKAMMPGAGLKAASMTDKEVKLLLEDLLQAQVLSQAQELARDEVKRLKGDLDVTMRAVEDAEKARKTSVARLAEYVAKHDSFEDDRNTEIMSVQRDISTEMKVVDLAMNVAKKWKKASTKLEALTIEYDEHDAKWKAANKQLLNVRNQHETDIQFAEIAVGLARGASAQAEADLQAYPKIAGTCLRCKQVLDPAHMKQHLDELKAKYDEAKLGFTAQANVLTALKECSAVKAQEARTVCRDIEQAMTAMNAEKKKLALISTEYEVAKANHATAKKRMTQLSERSEEIRARVSPFEDLILVEDTAIKQLETALKAYQEKLNTINSEKALYDFWVEGFSPGGLRSYMLEHVTPILNAKAQQYADILTDGEMTIVFHTKSETAGGESREKFNIEVKQRHGSSKYNGNSKGERAKADLAICMAIGDLASLRANKVIPFRFLDEPFESVDDSGTEAIVTLLNSQREQYDTVYVITHNAYFKDLFDKRLIVTKKNGESTVTNAKDEEDGEE